MRGLKNRRVQRMMLTFLSLLALAMPATAKIVVDFDPAIDFSKFKTFAYIGGVDTLVMLQINPDLIKDRVHRSISRELTQKGLREVQPNQSPDLVVRYWANSQTELAASANVNWGPYGPFVDSYWGFWFNNITTMSTRTGSLQIDVIDPHKKSLDWRLYIIDTITNSDKIWKEADKQITKGFESFPPSAKEVAEKQKEREEHKPTKPVDKSFQ
jgi:hypothetical protein